MVKMRGTLNTGKPARSMNDAWKKNLTQITFEMKMQKKQEIKEAKELEQAINEATRSKKAKARENAKKKLQTKEKDRFRSSSFQIVKDTKKISKMNKKLRQTLTKMPREEFYKIIHGKNID